MAVSIQLLTQKLASLNQQKTTRSVQPNWLLNTMPSLADWQTSTKVAVGKRGGNNPELLQIDGVLNTFHTTVARGARAKAIKDIKTIIRNWHGRRGPAAIRSERHAAMTALEQIVDELIRLVVYDNNAFISMITNESRPKQPDMVPGGFSDTGATTEACRLHCVSDFFAFGKTSAMFDTMNEARDAMKRNGLCPGADYTGGGACHSAQDWADENRPKKVMRLDGKLYSFRDLRTKRNEKDTHRFLIDANGVIFDPTWRQFEPGLRNTPGIFAGTVKELATIVAQAGGTPKDLDRRYATESDSSDS